MKPLKYFLSEALAEFLCLQSYLQIDLLLARYPKRSRHFESCLCRALQPKQNSQCLEVVSKNKSTFRYLVGEVLYSAHRVCITPPPIENRFVSPNEFAVRSEERRVGKGARR